MDEERRQELQEHVGQCEKRAKRTMALCGYLALMVFVLLGFLGLSGEEVLVLAAVLLEAIFALAFFTALVVWLFFRGRAAALRGPGEPREDRER
ncbi:MAG: hypothetical protein ACYTAF_05250 [Planctomycetota bacterium]|jgi:hypothetical protein